MKRVLAVVAVLAAVWTAATDRPAQAPAVQGPSRASTVEIATLSCVNWYACRETLNRYHMGTAGREEARAAVDSQRTLCAHGDGPACVDLAAMSAKGFEDFVPRDLAAARVFARRSCELGFYCEMVEDLSYPPPTAAELDDIREAVLRAGIPDDRPRNVTSVSPIWCLAFGTDADPEGVDPPPAFMARFADIEDVRPRSWCVEHRTGNRYSVGPIDAFPRLFSNGRTVRAWVLDQRFNGEAGSRMVQLSQKGGIWGAVETDYTATTGVPPFRRADLREDRRRIAATLSAFANAWNRRDYDQMARLHGLEQPLAGIQVDRWRAMLGGPAANARLEPAGVAIEFGDSGHMSATAQMRLRGTWPPRAGAIARGDPWQGKGSPATVQVTLRKETSWWEPGDWSVSDFWPPWVELAIVQ
jgi:hypothetical protein